MTQAILGRIQLLLANEAVVENKEWIFTGREAAKITMLTNELVMDSSGLVVYEKLENVQDWRLLYHFLMGVVLPKLPKH